MPLAPPRRIEALPIRDSRVRYGLFEVATVVDSPDIDHWRNGIAWTPDPCDPALGWTEDCPRPAIPATKDFNFGGAASATATGFTVYSTYQCNPLSRDVADAMARAERRLEISEEYTTEWIFSGRAALGNAPTVANASAVDLTPTSGAVNTLAGVSVLEDHIAREGFGHGIIHAQRGLVPALCNGNLVRHAGDRLLTCLDTPVAAGAGYQLQGPDGTDAPAGESWMYATSPVLVLRGPLHRYPADDPAQGFNHRTNDLRALVERDYVILHDGCVNAAVRVKNSCCC